MPAGNPSCSDGRIYFSLCHGKSSSGSSSIFRASSAFKPNLTPPITTTEMALSYKAQLEAIDPSVEYLMTLYLSPDLTPEEIRKAKAAGIAGEVLPAA